ncbi:hypothetical protein K503DRAFT_860205 [Rhizopogon vinicolor AM-OR11-026]|uniref:Uncharacterized protein n=1 Tax=Rhizopogon vinicolor AM-OR11-026 TaxID=1314800 RepID=A0A1B7MJ64_9AGAM|nr:hypothetical protein K503DRAFT_860205 [Rhizopogon vinicolor AM-OR11-026]
MFLPRSEGRLATRKIITGHFVQAEKCNYCSKSIEDCDDKPLKRILNRNACPTAPDRARTEVEVRNYLATKNGNQDLTLPPIAQCGCDSTSNFQNQLQEARLRITLLYSLTQTEEPLGFVDLPVTPEQATRANFKLFRSFAWVPPLTSDSRAESNDEILAGPESITDEDLLKEFDRFENEMREPRALQEGGDLFTDKVPDIFGGDIIDWNELEKVDKGIAPAGFIEEIDVVSHGSQGMVAGWNINTLLTSEGITSMNKFCRLAESSICRQSVELNPLKVKKPKVVPKRLVRDYILLVTTSSRFTTGNEGDGFEVVTLAFVTSIVTAGVRLQWSLNKWAHWCSNKLYKSRRTIIIIYDHYAATRFLLDRAQ